MGFLFLFFLLIGVWSGLLTYWENKYRSSLHEYNQRMVYFWGEKWSLVDYVVVCLCMQAIWMITLSGCSDSPCLCRRAWPVRAATCGKRMLCLPSVSMFSASSVWRRAMTPASANVPSVTLLLVPTISIASTLVDPSQKKGRGWLHGLFLINHQTSTSSLPDCHSQGTLSVSYLSVTDLTSRFSRS